MALPPPFNEDRRTVLLCMLLSSTEAIDGMMSLPLCPEEVFQTP